MTSEELRKQLKNYGFSAGPITPTTFQVYLRKLKSLRSRNNRVNQDLRRASAGRSTHSAVSGAADLNGFSSDESKFRVLRLVADCW